MVRNWMLLTTLLMLAAGGVVALAQAEKQPQKMHVGKIVEVAADHSQFTLQVGEAEQSHKVVLKVTAETKYELDGQPSTAAEALKVGAHARVRYSGDTATEVMVSTEKKAEKPANGHEKPSQGHEKH